jgi:hypothetical protein
MARAVSCTRSIEFSPFPSELRALSNTDKKHPLGRRCGLNLAPPSFPIRVIPCSSAADPSSLTFIVGEVPASRLGGSRATDETRIEHGSDTGFESPVVAPCYSRLPNSHPCQSVFIRGRSCLSSVRGYPVQGANAATTQLSTSAQQVGSASRSLSVDLLQPEEDTVVLSKRPIGGCAFLNDRFLSKRAKYMPIPYGGSLWWPMLCWLIQSFGSLRSGLALAPGSGPESTRSFLQGASPRPSGHPVCGPSQSAARNWRSPSPPRRTQEARTPGRPERTQPCHVLYLVRSDAAFFATYRAALVYARTTSDQAEPASPRMSISWSRNHCVLKSSVPEWTVIEARGGGLVGLSSLCQHRVDVPTR